MILRFIHKKNREKGRERLNCNVLTKFYTLSVWMIPVVFYDTVWHKDTENGITASTYYELSLGIRTFPILGGYDLCML